jgi:hypothetical protein
MKRKQVERAQTVSSPSGQVFNPEGGLEDCQDAESYYFESGGAFVVVSR